MSLFRPRPVQVLCSIKNSAFQSISTRRRHGSEPWTRKTIAMGLLIFQRLRTFIVVLWVARMQHDGPCGISLFCRVRGFPVVVTPRFHQNAPPSTTSSSSLRALFSTNAVITDSLMNVQPSHSSEHDGFTTEAFTTTNSKGLQKNKLTSTGKDIMEATTTTTTTTTSKGGGKQKDNRSPSSGAIFWRLEDDPFRIEKVANNRTTLTFKIRGNPLPLRRHRTSRGFMYNPSAASQAVFRNLVRELIWPDELPSETNGLSLFGDRDQLSVSMLFCMKRPLNHFTSSKRAEGRLKETASNRVGPIRTDVDNLAKFILDSLNGMIYHDDKQVASVHATKCYDSEGLCEGSTLVCIRNLRECDLEDLLNIKL